MDWKRLPAPSGIHAVYSTRGDVHSSPYNSKRIERSKSEEDILFKGVMARVKNRPYSFFEQSSNWFASRPQEVSLPFIA